MYAAMWTNHSYRSLHLALVVSWVVVSSVFGPDIHDFLVRHTKCKDSDMGNKEMYKTETNQQVNGGITNGEHCKWRGLVVWEIEFSEEREDVGVRGVKGRRVEDGPSP